MLTITSHSHPYTVTVFPDLQAALRDYGGEAKTLFLVDRNVAELYRASIFSVVPEDRVLQIEATEQAKSYERLTEVFTWAIERGAQRSTQLVVVGGGILQDIGCFVASVLFRGLRWTLVPTTLLAQCDSCIGSKSSLNIGRFKNQLGTFYSPHEVRLVHDVLKTLETDDLRSGLGEAVKIAWVDSANAVDRVRQHLQAWQTAPEVLAQMVREALTIKKRFIEADEFDRGIRNFLNFGHTFAHAFESATHFAVPHGIAVSLGVACAAHVSEALGLTDREAHRALVDWLRPLYEGHQRTVQGAPIDALLAAMKTDKKNQGAGITFILTRGPGQMEKRSLSVDEARTLLGASLKAL